MNNKDETFTITISKKEYDMWLKHSFNSKANSVVFISDKSVQITMPKETYNDYYGFISYLKTSGFGKPYYR